MKNIAGKKIRAGVRQFFPSWLLAARKHKSNWLLPLQPGKTENQAHQVDKGDWAGPPDCWKPPRVMFRTRPSPLLPYDLS